MIKASEMEVAVVPWEYVFVDVSRLQNGIDELNRRGSEGWEAVGMVSTWGAKEWRFVHPVLLMKRQVDQSP